MWNAVCSYLTYIDANTVTNTKFEIWDSEISGYELRVHFVHYHLKLMFTVYISNRWQHQSGTFTEVLHLTHFYSSLISWGVSTTKLKAHIQHNLQPVPSASDLTIYFTDNHLNVTLPIHCLSSKCPPDMKFSHEKYMQVSCVPIWSINPTHHNILDIIILTILGYVCKITTEFVCNIQNCPLLHLSDTANCHHSLCYLFLCLNNNKERKNKQTW
jgi:hypothetical protein